MCLLASFHVTVAGALVVSTGWWPVTAPVLPVLAACTRVWSCAALCVAMALYLYYIAAYQLF